jgi:hypothetical protein
MYGLMKCAVQVTCYGFVWCLSFAGLNTVGHAGEALIIGPEKGLIEPGKKSKSENPLFGGSIGKLDSPSPLGGLVPTIIPNGRSFSAKEQKRQRDAADEKANWILLDPGELQNKDETESTFGVKEKDYSVEGLEKEDNSRDYTFRGVGKTKKPTPEMLKQIQLIKQNKEEPESVSHSEGPSLSAHTASELNLKSLFEPKTDKAFGNSGLGGLTLKDLFKAPMPGMNEDLQNKHKKDFDNFLRGSSGPALRDGNDFKGGGSSPMDWTKAPANNNSPLFGSTPAQTYKSPTAPVVDQNFGRPALSPNAQAPSYQENRSFGSTSSDPPRRRF